MTMTPNTRGLARKPGAGRGFALGGNARAKLAAALARMASSAGPAPDPDAPDAPAEVIACRDDCAHFIDNYCVIDDTQGHGDGGGTMPFRLWDAQRGVVSALCTERLLVILKARQLGISWLCCAYVLWRALFRPNQVVLLFSQGEDEANEMLRRAKVMYERLPDWLRAALPDLAKDNTGELIFANGSRIKSMPATQRAGRSFTASVVVMDEAAHMMWGDKLYTAVKPTIDAGGTAQLVILSTANGLGNLFHQVWIKAVAGINKFRTVFLPWWARPGRDQEWYDGKIAEESDPARIKQEYPANPNEAFLATGRARFPSEWIEAQAGNVRKGMPQEEWPGSLRGVPGLTVYLPFDESRRYVLAGDVAEGLEHGDYSTGVLIDADSWEEVASIHGHWEPDQFARYLMMIGRAYGECCIIPERNNHGHAVLATLKADFYPRVGNGMDERPGWLSNIKTKPESIDILATALRDRAVIVHTQAALDEMQIYKVLKDGKTGAPESYHDDRVMAWAVGLAFIRMAMAEVQPGTAGGPRPEFSPAPAYDPPGWAAGIPGSLL